MFDVTLICLGSFIVFAWGIAHLFPTGNVVRAFGGISADNRRIITMEWISEGVTLIFTGVLVAVVTCLDHSNPVSKSVYWLAFGLLNTLSLVSIFTGFRNTFIAFKLCPIIFTGSSLLILFGGLLG
jgi:fructose-specific phosphotransferase system IIC component